MDLGLIIFIVLHIINAISLALDALFVYVGFPTITEAARTNPILFILIVLTEMGLPASIIYHLIYIKLNN